MADYIDRESLLSLETVMVDTDGFEHSCVLSVDVRRAKAADVVPVRHGRWDESRRMIRRVNRTNIPVVECSVCGITFCDLINNHKFMYHFCPQCGAKMDGENNGEQV